MLPEGRQDVQDLYVGLTHRELPPAVLVAMGLFNNSDLGGSEAAINDAMPLGRINRRRAWRSSHALPFLDNIALERLNCTASPGFADGDYYRAVVNGVPQDLPDGCGDGPGTSCSRGRFAAYVRGRAAQVRRVLREVRRLVTRTPPAC